MRRVKKGSSRRLFFRAVFLLIGTIIGAGIFSLPYAFSLSGSLLGSFGLIFLTGVTLALSFFYLKIITATRGDHQLPGYAECYLGKWGKIVATLAIVLSGLGALLAYVILGGDFLALLFGGGSGRLYSFLFWSWGAFFIFRGTKTIVAIEEWLTFALIVLTIAIPVWGSRYFSGENLSFPVVGKSLAFYGPVLYALSGIGVIPEVEEVLRSRSSLLPRAIFWGTVIPAVIYLVFALGVLGISGAFTTADALSGLWAWSPGLVKLGAGVGFFATFTSFLSFANVIKEVLCRDWGGEERSSLFFPVALAFPAVFLSLKYFLPIVSLTGAVAIGGIGILVVIIYLKDFSRSFADRALALLVGAILLGGMIGEVF